MLIWGSNNHGWNLQVSEVQIATAHMARKSPMKCSKDILRGKEANSEKPGPGGSSIQGDQGERYGNGDDVHGSQGNHALRTIQGTEQDF